MMMRISTSWTTMISKMLANLWFKLPLGLRNQFTAYQLGYLTTMPSLRSREVPTITVQEFMQAMKEAEGRAIQVRETT
jgi:hypothetical protein